MKVFLSWSGDQSRELAEVLREWLPAVLQSIKPFFTPSDIEKGARWNKDISQELEASSFGIFCLTKENLARPWLMFEAGALSKRIDTSRVCPVLFGVDSSDLEGPLVQFQASPFSETEMRKLVKTLNAGLGDHRLEDGVLSSVFEMWWPKLSERVARIMDRFSGLNNTAPTTRTDRDLLEEVLQLTRLSATANDRLPRAPLQRGDGDALAHALKKILELIEQVELDESEPLLPFILKIFHPLEYIAKRGHYSAKTERELEEVVRRIEEKLASAA